MNFGYYSPDDNCILPGDLSVSPLPLARRERAQKKYSNATQMAMRILKIAHKNNRIHPPPQNTNSRETIPRMHSAKCFSPTTSDEIITNLLVCLLNSEPSHRKRVICIWNTRAQNALSLHA